MQDKIILLGYMGSGKSTIAKLLAHETNLPFIDLDNRIEIQEGMTVSEVFKQKGEIHFRKIEHQLFKELMQNTEKFVLSLGGGTPCYANNHELLNGHGITSIYLKASIAELCERLTRNKSKRPLIALKTDDAIEEFIAKHLFERSYFYNKATHTVNVNGKSPSMIVSEIAALLV